MSSNHSASVQLDDMLDNLSRNTILLSMGAGAYWGKVTLLFVLRSFSEVLSVSCIILYSKLLSKFGSSVE